MCCSQPFLALARQDSQRYQEELRDFSKAIGDEVLPPFRSRKRKRPEIPCSHRAYTMFLRDMTDAAKEKLACMSYNHFQQLVAAEWKVMPEQFRQHWVGLAESANDRRRDQLKHANAYSPTKQQSTMAKTESKHNAEDNAVYDHIIRVVAAAQAIPSPKRRQPATKRGYTRSDPSLKVSICPKSTEKAVQIIKKLFPNIDTQSVKTSLINTVQRLTSSKKIDSFSVFVGGLKGSIYPLSTSYNDIQRNASLQWKKLTRAQKQV